MKKAEGTALVTGASSGIGRELAKILARNGYNLVLVARNEPALKELGADLESQERIQCTIIPKDFSDPHSPREIYDATIRQGLTIDVLVNNAGFGAFGLFMNTDMEAEMQLLQVNIVTLTALTKLFVRDMANRKRGRILNVASTAAFQPGPLMATYYASKAFVLSFSEALANELNGAGVTVTALCPGPVQTDFQRRAGMEKSGLMRRLGVMDAGTVARAGYDAMMRGKTLVIPGALNKILAWSTRFAPRKMATSLARKIQEEKV